jgi:hypothetical protein
MRSVADFGDGNQMSNWAFKGTLFASLVLPMASATKKEKKRKEEAYPWKAGASSGHITNLKQSILETFDIYGWATQGSQGKYTCSVVNGFEGRL